MIALALGLLVAGAPMRRADAQATVTSAAAERKNVLLILVDDLRPEIGAYGSARAITPNMDRLAATGVLFERAYTQIAVCAPSRAALLTGLRPDSTRIYDLVTPLRTVMPATMTMPRFFKSQGYTTMSLGKVYHHHDDDPQGWSMPPLDAEGAWHGRGYLAESSIRAVESFAATRGTGSGGRGPAFEAANVPDTAYPDGKLANLAIERLIKRSVGVPFFLAVGFNKPHLPFNAPQKYWNLYPAERVMLPSNDYPPSNVTPYTLTTFGELRAYTDMPKQGNLSPEQARALNRGYLASVSYVDAQIGRVLDALNSLGLTRNTIVVLWGDHGYKLGEHAQWTKHANFELDTRIPLIVRAPGVTSPGGRSRAFVETVDVFATVSELAGLPIPPQQGTSMVPVLANPLRDWKTAAFSQFPREAGNRVMGRSIRTDRYRYVEWTREATGEVLARELYDHATDPQENANVAAMSRRASTVASLARRLREGWRAARPGDNR
ncbi:MAG: sulfatase [Gemmatimonadaceae bacterium]